jgi:hypothetical protein
MLLNEMQKDHATVAALAAQNEVDAAKIASLEQHEQQKTEAQDAEIRALKGQLIEMHATLVALQAKDQIVARR